MLSPFLCSPVVRECSWKKTQTEKNFLFSNNSKSKRVFRKIYAHYNYFFIYVASFLTFSENSSSYKLLNPLVSELVIYCSDLVGQKLHFQYLLKNSNTFWRRFSRFSPTKNFWNFKICVIIINLVVVMALEVLIWNSKSFFFCIFLLILLTLCQEWNITRPSNCCKKQLYQLRKLCFLFLMVFKREFGTVFIYFNWATDYGTEIEV